MHGASSSHSLISYGLLGALAIALLVAGLGDLAHRRIGNRLTGSIALAAPLFWWAGGLSLAAAGWQVALAAACLMLGATLFAGGTMGGGDVKLLTALALWIPPLWYAQLLVVMALAGGLLALAWLAHRAARRSQPARGAVAARHGATGETATDEARASDSIPYGIAIAAGGLWVLARDYLPLAGANLSLMIGS